jgi:hypothetical protein
MAVEQSIIDALEHLTAEDNAKEQRAVKAVVRVPTGHRLNVAQGRGNYTFGRFCVYDVFLIPDNSSFRYYPLLRIKHDDGRAFPATVISSDPPKEEEVGSENAMKEVVRRILNSDEASQAIESLSR